MSLYLTLFIAQLHFILSKWFEPRSISSSYCVIVWVRVVLKRTVVGDWRFDNLSGRQVIFRVKWIVFISRWCYKVGPLNVIGKFSHDGTGWKTRQRTNHNIDWDSAQCLTYSTNYFQRLTLESWYTNLDQTPLNRCQQLPPPYKRLIHDRNETDKRTSNRPT